MTAVCNECGVAGNLADVTTVVMLKIDREPRAEYERSMVMCRGCIAELLVEMAPYKKGKQNENRMEVGKIVGEQAGIAAAAAPVCAAVPEK